MSGLIDIVLLVGCIVVAVPVSLWLSILDEEKQLDQNAAMALRAADRERQLERYYRSRGGAS